LSQVRTTRRDFGDGRSVADTRSAPQGNLMKQPLQIQFLGMEPSHAVESAVREKAQKLDRFCADLMSCRVAIELAHKHQQQGRPFAVRITVTLPGHELAVDRVENEDVHVAVRDAFDDMTRQLEDAVRRSREGRNA